MKPCLSEETSCRYQCNEYGAWPLKSLNVFEAIILPIWTIYSNSPIWNMISETHLVLNSQNFILLHTASGLFVIMALNYGISCHIGWRIPKTWTCSRKTLQSGVTADNVSLLMFSNSIQVCYYFVGNSMNLIWCLIFFNYYLQMALYL